MVAGQAESRPWNQGSTPCDEVFWAEQDVGGTVLKRVLGPVDDLTGTIDGKPIDSDGGPRDTATQSLEAITLMGLTGDGGIERKAIRIGRERFRNGVGSGEARILQGQRPAALAGSAACDYLELTGVLAYGWLRAWMVGVSEAAFEQEGADVDFLHGKTSTGDFFHARLLPLAATFEQRIISGSAPVMTITEQQFLIRSPARR